MNIINKVGETITQSVDFIVDKSRQAAYLNRLKVIIDGEQETLDCAYIALGKQYAAVLEGQEANEEENKALLEALKNSKLRIKKARARYEYTIKYGVPKEGVAPEDIADGKNKDANADDKDDQDITIAYADPAAEDAAIDAAIDECMTENDKDNGENN
ncbi:MAG: hypothetical protein IJU51_04080 [Clostridia bacterium]|nr:hypothetical protein [Clostridia bacterium]